MNILFPPIVPTYQPVFISGSNTYRIYFSLSQYNTLGDINNLQLTIVNQATNLSMLNKSTEDESKNVYLNEIKVYASGDIQSADSSLDYQYYVTLTSSDLKSDLILNQYYKIQIRLGNSGETLPNPITNTWFVENAANCSEWSTISLLFGISEPTLNLKSLNFNNNTYTYNSSTLSVSGNVSFSDGDSETLSNYSCELYSNNNTLLAKSNIIDNNLYSNLNEINYTFNYMLVNNQQYKLKINITTRNLYQTSFEYTFTASFSIDSALAGTIAAVANKERGCLVVSFTHSGTAQSNTAIALRRSSSRSNFTIWEDIQISATDNSGNYTWSDYTIESGIWYKYSIQKYSAGARSAELVTATAAMCAFEDMFLLKNNIQLRIRFNPKITTFKRTISESKIDTIGSQYPYIKRSGNIDYYNIGISGLITLHDDYYYDDYNPNTGEVFSQLFKTKTQVFNGYNDVVTLYENYNADNKITLYNDFIYEREFRKHVIDYLYDDSATLLRTATEGNFLIRIMDVNLSPQEGLGRRLYDFSANTYEIDDCTLENLNKYNIISISESDS